MANKGKRARNDISSDPEINKDDLISRLRSELDVERKMCKKLRREKAFEVQQTKELGRNDASILLKDLATKLHHEKQREMEAQREALRCKYETDTVKVMKQKDQEVKKLKNDLAKCQDELREEVTKRGLSTSARGTFELERTKLLQEIKELGASKKRLEDTLHSANETAKQKTQEMRQLQETCKQEMAAVEKAANAEVRKLLEEMKAKDHMLALVDRNQYPDKSNNIKQQLANQSIQELVTASMEIDSWEQKLPKKGEGTESMSASSLFPNLILQKKVYDLEKQLRQATGVNHAILEKNQEITASNKTLEETIEKLQKQNKQMNADLDTVRVEASRLSELLSSNSIEMIACQVESLKRKAKEQEITINELRLECEEKGRQNKLIAKSQQQLEKPKCLKKAVTFLLPGESQPVKGGVDRDLIYEDDVDDVESYVSSLSTDSELSEFTTLLSPTNIAEDDDEITEMLPESEMKDYNQLMKEHLQLEHSYALMIQSQPDQDWHIERESLNLAILTLERKIRECEDSEEQLKMKLQDVCEQNEELEFQILELEDSNGAMNFAQHEIADLALMEKNQRLEIELELLKKQLDQHISEGSDSERDVAIQCFIPLPTKDEMENTCEIDLSDHDRNEAIMMSSISTNTSGFEENNFEIDAVAEVLDDTVTVERADNHESGEDGINIPCCEQKMEVAGEDLKSNEHWLRLVENLEMRLCSSRERERQMSDKMALMNEEKNRRIRALQEQVDMLEGCDCSILETKIDANEEMTDGNKRQVMNSDVDEERGTLMMKLELSLDWSERSEDVLSGTPSSIDIPGSYFPDKRMQEVEEDGLYLQITNLEKDCELLREIVDMDEGIISDLQIKVEDLQQSEQNLQQIVERLEAAENRLRTNATEREDLVHDLEAEVRRLQTSQGWSRAQLEKFQTSEHDLSKKLEEMMEDMQDTEQKLKRKITELEQEKQALMEKTEKLEDRVGELEAIDGLLRQKIRNVQYSEGALQKRLSGMELEMVVNGNHNADLEQQKEGLAHQVQILEKEKIKFIEELEELRRTGDARYCEVDQLNKRISALKETLSKSEGMVSLLRSQLKDSTCREAAFQSEAQDCRDNEDILLENITMLEGSVLLLTEKLKQFPECCTCNAKNAVVSVTTTTNEETQTPPTEMMSDVKCCHLNPNLLVLDQNSDSMMPETDFISDDVESCADDAQSIDEASEISDEDDGALLLLAEKPSTAFGDTFLLQCRTISGSLDSIHDSGMDSMRICETKSTRQQMERNTTQDQSTQTVYSPPLPIFRQFFSNPGNCSAIYGKNLKQNTISPKAKEEKREKTGKHSHIPLSTRYLDVSKNRIWFSCKPPNQTYITLPQTVLAAAKNTRLNNDLNSFESFKHNSETIAETFTCPSLDSSDNQSVKRCIGNNQSEVFIEDQSYASHQPPSSQMSSSCHQLSSGTSRMILADATAFAAAAEAAASSSQKAGTMASAF